MTYTVEEKILKKKKILEATLSLFKNSKFEDIKMIDIANKLKVAKGVLYNFFSSKEEIFIALYCDELLNWFEEIESIFSKKMDLNSKLKIMVQFHVKRLMLLKLMNILNSILEGKLDYEKTLELKKFLYNNINKLADKIYPHEPDFAKEIGSFLIHYNAQTIGLLQMAPKTPKLKKIFSTHSELKIFDIDLENELLVFINHYFRS